MNAPVTCRAIRAHRLMQTSAGTSQVNLGVSIGASRAGSSERGGERGGEGVPARGGRGECVYIVVDFRRFLFFLLFSSLMNNYSTMMRRIHEQVRTGLSIAKSEVVVENCCTRIFSLHWT